MELEFLYSVERTYPVDLATMWNAWTTESAIESWYHPTELSVLSGSVVCEPRHGGRWSVAINVPEHNFVAYFYGRYSAIEMHRKLEHSMFYVETAQEFEDRDESRPNHEVVIDFEDRDGQTWVRYSQFGELPEGHAERAKAGMESYFDSLAAYLAK